MRNEQNSFFAILDRHLLLLAFAFIYAGLLSFWALPYVPISYTAKAKLLIQPSSIDNSANLQNYLMNEVHVLQSNTFKTRARHSAYDYEYALNTQRKGSGFRSLNVSAENLNDIQPAAGNSAHVSNRIDFSNVVISGGNETPFIEITYSAKNPSDAARVVNQYALSYMENFYQKAQQFEERKAPARQVSNEILPHAAIFQTVSNQIDTMIEDISKTRDSLEKDLIVLEDRILAIENEISEHESTIKSLKSSLDKPNSSKIRKMHAAQKSKQNELDELSQRYGHKHPKIKAIAEEIVQYTYEINAAAQKIKGRQHEKILKHQNEISLLERQLDTVILQKDILSTQANKSLKMRSAIQDQLTGLKDLVSGLATSNALFQEASYKAVKADVATLPYTVKIESLASSANLQQNSAKEHTLAFIMIITFAIVCMFIFFKERLRALRYFSSRDIESDTELDCMASIPDVSKTCKISQFERTKNPPPEVEKSLSALALKLDSKLETKNHLGYVVTLTSSISNEGKTQTLLWLARIFANAGKKVVILDGNLREPNLHEATGRGNTTSVVDYLTNKKTLNEIIHMNERLNIDMIFSKTTPDNANRLLSSSKMTDLIEDLKRRYDVVLIDTPSCLTFADVLIFAKLSDQVLYNIRYGKTKKDSVFQGLKQIKNALNKPISFIFAQIDPSEKRELSHS